MPKDIGTLKFKTTLAKDSYKVTVKISVAGKNSFATYAEFTVNGSSGKYTLLDMQEFVEPSNSTTTTSSTTEADTTTTTVSDLV